MFAYPPPVPPGKKRRLRTDSTSEGTAATTVAAPEASRAVLPVEKPTFEDMEEAMVGKALYVCEVGSLSSRWEVACNPCARVGLVVRLILVKNVLWAKCVKAYVRKRNAPLAYAVNLSRHPPRSRMKPNLRTAKACATTTLFLYFIKCFLIHGAFLNARVRACSFIMKAGKLISMLMNLQ